MSAGPPSDLKPPIVAADQERLGWIRTYYPGVADAQSAAKITVRAGSELWGQDITLRAAPVRRLRGVLLDSNGDAAPHVPVHLGRVEEVVPDDVSVVTGDDGSFEFPVVHDGEWGAWAQLQSNGVKLRAFAAAHLMGRDLDRLELRLMAPFTVIGSFSFAGSADRRPEKAPEVFLKPSVSSDEGFKQVRANRDGSFKIENIYPGLYKVVALSPGPPYFVGSIRMGGADVLGQYIQIASGALPIEVMLESNGGGVRGRVEDCGSATVALLPQDRIAQDPQFVRTSRCGEAGRFDVADVRPGSYYAFAFDQWEGPVELLSGLDQALANQAVSVRVEPGQVANVELRVTSRNR